MRAVIRWCLAVVVAISLSFTFASGAFADPGEGPSQATASKGKGSKKLKLSLVKTGQNDVTGKGVKIKVRGAKRSKVKVKLSSKSFDEGKRRLAKTRTVKLGRSGRKVIRIRATKSARKAAATCSARSILAKARSGKRRATKQEGTWSARSPTAASTRST